MRPNNYRFIELVSQVHRLEPIVEYGSCRVSKDQEKINNLRKLFKRLDYTGYDLATGKGVDKVDDLVYSSLQSKSVGTLLCCETLEHVFEVHKAVKQLIRIVKKDGLIVVTIPSGDFPLHMLPDYWRISSEALDKLFEKIPYRTIVFQGFLECAHTVMGTFTFDKQVHEKVRNHLFTNMTSIPAVQPEDNIYLWINASTYCRQRFEKGTGKVIIEEIVEDKT